MAGKSIVEMRLRVARHSGIIDKLINCFKKKNDEITKFSGQHRHTVA
jgi:hypothetical protein